MATELKVIRPDLVIKCQECEREGNHPKQAGMIVDGQLLYYVEHHGRLHPVRIDIEWLKRVLAA